MVASRSLSNTKTSLKFKLCSNRKRVWTVSALAVIISFLGLSLSWLNPSIGLPLRPGLDFTGGTQIQLTRNCESDCQLINTTMISNSLATLSLPSEGNNASPSLLRARVQILDDSNLIVIRLPFLSASQGQTVIDAINVVAGPLRSG